MIIVCSLKDLDTVCKSIKPSHVISVIDPGFAPETPDGVTHHLKLGFDDILEASPDNQIYRLAQSFYGLNNGEIVSKRQLQLLAKTWFGTLAGIIVLVPILLSFGAFQFRKKEYKEIL